MNYLISLYKNESKDVEIEADSPEAALKQARAANPGFHSDGVVEIVDGEPSEDFMFFGECENCSKILWENSDFGMYDEGYCICSDYLSK